MFSFLSCEVLKMDQKIKAECPPFGRKMSVCVAAALRCSLECSCEGSCLTVCPTWKDTHCQVANIFHSILLLLRTTTVHFIELQQCAKHDRFITLQVHNPDWTRCSFAFLIFVKRINRLPKVASTHTKKTSISYIFFENPADQLEEIPLKMENENLKRKI